MNTRDTTTERSKLLLLLSMLPYWVLDFKKNKVQNLLSLDLFGGECALLMDIQSLRPQRTVPVFSGSGTCCLAAGFEGHAW